MCGTYYSYLCQLENVMESVLYILFNILYIGTRNFLFRIPYLYQKGESKKLRAKLVVMILKLFRVEDRGYLELN